MGSLTLWGRVLTDGRELPASRVEVADQRIMALAPSAGPSAGDLVVEDGWICPGLIDLQVNGADGVDLTSATEPRDALLHVARTLAQHGVTAFCPTIVSSPLETIERALAAYGPQSVPCGAQSLGVHIEGPFINPDHRGVHDPSVIRLASIEELDGWLRAGRPSIVTLAPERPGGFQAVARLAAAGIVVSIGHSGATAVEAQAALAAGARMATHLFNGMKPMHHRDPGLIGALLAGQAVLGLIADGIHVDPLIVDLVVNRAGAARVSLVSDALAAAGAPPGQTILGEQAVVSDGRVVRRLDGTLAGSALLLDGCLRNMRAWLPNVPAARLIEMATRTPASVLGLPHKGRVAVGCDADLVVLDRDFNVQMTVVRGEIVSESRLAMAPRAGEVRGGVS